jgi:hypothetical protein
MKTKTIKITLESFGSYLGMKKGCFTVKNREGQIERYPLFKNLIDEIRIKSGKRALCFKAVSSTSAVSFSIAESTFNPIPLHR